MRSIVIDTNSRLELIAQLAERQAVLPAPMRWFELLNELSLEVTGVGATERDWWHTFTSKAHFFSMHFSLETILTALVGRRFTYLCWGLPRREKWKMWVIAMILRRAEHVLVNDITTQREIEALCGRRAIVVPFFIDTEFFTFRVLQGRSDFLFCNGSNDRDSGVILGLAQRGFKVIWLVNDFALRARYVGRHPNLELLSDISFEELRELYQNCAMNIMPVLHDRHCAGQTTIMEAIACGAPVLISKGRTASIFSDLPSVSTQEGSNIDAWVASLTALDHDGALAAKAVFSRELLQDRSSRQSLKHALTPFLDFEDANQYSSKRQEKVE